MRPDASAFQGVGLFEEENRASGMDAATVTDASNSERHPAALPASEHSASTAEPGAQAKSRKSGRPPGDRELRKLRRVDLLELLVGATRENEQLAEQLAETTDLADRLRAKLDEKDAQIAHLKERLDAKDAKIKALKAGQTACQVQDIGKSGKHTASASGSDVLTVDAILDIERAALQQYLEQRASRGGLDPSATKRSDKTAR